MGGVRIARQSETEHPRLCHKCKYNDKGNPVCLKCQPTAEGFAHGVEWHDTEEVERTADPNGDFRERLDGVTEESDDLARLRFLVSTFAQMPVRSVIILHGLLNGLNLTEIGESVHQSRALVHYELKRTIAKYPWIAKLHYSIGRPGLRRPDAPKKGTRPLKSWNVA